MYNRPLKKIREPEIWKQYKNTNLYLSDQGRAKRVFKNGAEYEVGHMYKYSASGQICLKMGKKEVPIKNLVYELFKGKKPEGLYIVHKNGLKRDNSIYNLELRTKSEHGKITGAYSNAQKVINKSTGIVYRSAREAGRKLYCSRQTVCEICNGERKKPIYDLYWLDEDNEMIFRGKYGSHLES